MCGVTKTLELEHISELEDEKVFNDYEMEIERLNQAINDCSNEMIIEWLIQLRNIRQYEMENLH